MAPTAWREIVPPDGQVRCRERIVADPSGACWKEVARLDGQLVPRRRRLVAGGIEKQELVTMEKDGRLKHTITARPPAHPDDENQTPWDEKVIYFEGSEERPQLSYTRTTGTTREMVRYSPDRKTSFHSRESEVAPDLDDPCRQPWREMKEWVGQTPHQFTFSRVRRVQVNGRLFDEFKMGNERSENHWLRPLDANVQEARKVPNTQLVVDDLPAFPVYGALQKDASYRKLQGAIKEIFQTHPKLRSYIDSINIREELGAVIIGNRQSPVDGLSGRDVLIRPTSAKFSILHEIGHNFDTAQGGLSTQPGSPFGQGSLAKGDYHNAYSATNAREDFANEFAFLTFNNKNLDSLSPQDLYGWKQMSPLRRRKQQFILKALQGA